MLGKLMKYDMKSMSRAFIPMWILAPVISLLLSVSIRSAIEWTDNPLLSGMINAGLQGMCSAMRAGIIFWEISC